MHTTGLLTVKTNFIDGRLVILDLVLHRPQVAQLFLGKTPEFVVKSVPLLYSVCAKAQGVASQSALDGAVTGSFMPASDTALWTELLHESLWRVLLDWPPLLGLPAAKEAFVTWHTTRHGSAAAEVTEQLLAGVVTALSESCLKRIPRAEDSCRYEALQFDPGKWLDSYLSNTATEPSLQPPTSVRSAYLARIAQLHMASRALASKTPYPLAVASAQGWGVAQVATARGVLTHVAQVVNGNVATYRVCAPTDAYFADTSALLALLGQRNFSSLQEARFALDLAVLALDPCVPVQTEVSNA